MSRLSFSSASAGHVVASAISWPFVSMLASRESPGHHTDGAIAGGVTASAGFVGQGGGAQVSSVDGTLPAKLVYPAVLAAVAIVGVPIQRAAWRRATRRAAAAPPNLQKTGG